MKKIINYVIVCIIDIGIIAMVISYGYYLDKIRKKEIEGLTVLEDM